LIVLAALAAAVAKLYCAATTIGTNDVKFFYLFAVGVTNVGVTAMYDQTSAFNHTPLVGEMLVAMLHLAQRTHTSFSFWLRLPGIVADFVSVLALLWFRNKTGRPPWWALAVFALSPVSFMVSGYHGNVDPILAMFVVLAACACVAGQSLLCGIFLGLACNIKIVPLLLVPVFFFFWQSRRGLWSFLVSFAVVVLAGWGVALVLTPAGFVRNVLSYAGYWGEWGITCGLYVSGLAPFQPLGFVGLSPAERAVMMLLKVIIVGGITFIAWRRRAAEPAAIFSSLALAWVVFFVLAPGVGPQYLVWFAPFLLVHSPRWYLAVTAVCTVFLTVFYTVISHGIPWNYGESTQSLSPVLRPWTALPWLALTVLLVASIREIFARPASPEAAKDLA
jgi:uncharacterized membrane protein